MVEFLEKLRGNLIRARSFIWVKLFKRFSVPLTVIEISGICFMVFFGCILGTKASVQQELLS